MIYAFEFSDRRVYVGLTYDLKKRKREHLTFPKSSVKEHIEKTNLTPNLKILTNLLPSKISRLKEIQWLNQYKKNNWTLLNKIKAGGLGGTKIRIWNKRKCLLDAKRFNSRKQWSKKSAGAYDAALRYGWYHECVKHMVRPRSSRLKWTKKLCRIEALKFKTKGEWKRGSYGSYQAAQTYGWFNYCNKHMPRNIRWK